MDYQQDPNQGNQGYQDPNAYQQQPQQPQYQAPPPQYPEPQPPMYGGGYPPPPPIEPQGNPGIAVAALILGISALVLTVSAGWFPYVNLLPLGVSIAGLIVSIMARKKAPGNGLATGGLIMSIIALSISAIMFITCTICVTCIAFSDSAYYYY